jgi:hypothetical protein
MSSNVSRVVNTFRYNHVRILLISFRDFMSDDENFYLYFSLFISIDSLKSSSFLLTHLGIFYSLLFVMNLLGLL